MKIFCTAVCTSGICPDSVADRVTQSLDTCPCPSQWPLIALLQHFHGIQSLFSFAIVFNSVRITFLWHGKHEILSAQISLPDNALTSAPEVMGLPRLAERAEPAWNSSHHEAEQPRTSFTLCRHHFYSNGNIFSSCCIKQKMWNILQFLNLILVLPWFPHFRFQQQNNFIFLYTDCRCSFWHINLLHLFFFETHYSESSIIRTWGVLCNDCPSSSTVVQIMKWWLQVS